MDQDERKKGYVTIKDIARELGLSTSTVSRALRDQPDVHPDTRRQVQQTAERLHYQPNLFASGLVSRRTHLIGVVVPRIANHFFSAITSGIQNVAYQHDYKVIICESDHSIQREKLNMEALLSVRVDGILMAPCTDFSHDEISHLQAVKAREVPMVYVDRIQPEVPSSSVLIDDFKAAEEATSYLIKTGCTRIAHFTGPMWTSVCVDRKAGFLEAMQKHGLSVPEEWIVETGFESTPATEAMMQLWRGQRKPDALLAVNDRVAVGAAIALRELGVAIPEQMSLIGFSDNPVSAMISPSITTVRQPAYEMGEMAANLLLQQIEATQPQASLQRHTLDTRLILRESTRLLHR